MRLVVVICHLWILNQQQEEHPISGMCEIILGESVYLHIFSMFKVCKRLYVNVVLKKFLKILFIYFREGERRERGRETLMCGCLLHTPRHVPWLGVEPATSWFTGRHSIHWTTPAMAENTFYIGVNNLS